MVEVRLRLRVHGVMAVISSMTVCDSITMSNIIVSDVLGLHGRTDY